MSIVESCPYKCAARLTAPAWAPVSCSVLCVGTIFSCFGVGCTCCCINYQDPANSDRCTPRGPAKQDLDRCAITMLKLSSFYPDIDREAYDAIIQVAKKADYQGKGMVAGIIASGEGAVVPAGDTWTNHCMAFCNTAAHINAYAFCCGLPCSLCSCSSKEKDLGIQMFKSSVTGQAFKGYQEMK